MFEALGRGAYRWRRWVLVAAVAFVGFAGVWGTGVFGRLTGSGFDDPGSDSFKAAQLATERLGRNEPDVIVVYRDPARTVDDPAFRRAVTGTLGALPGDVVERSTSWWSSGAASLVSADRHSTYAVLQLRGETEEQRMAGLETISDRLRPPGLQTLVGGGDVLSRDINSQVGEDIARAETLSMPVLLVLLVLIFGSVAAAGLPLAIGVLSILGAFTALRALTAVTDVSVFSINIITILGMGLAIDYGLFVVSRFREELRTGLDTEQAVVRTMATAGRTVAVSGMTVAVALAGLTIFPQVFLRSMGFGGVAAVLVAMVAALTVLPALLSVLGPRVDALAIRPLLRRRERAAASPDTGPWARIARSVMRRPVAYAVGVVVVLLALGLPFLRVNFGGIDARALPAGTESRVVAETLDRDFGANAGRPIEAVVTLPDRVDSAAGKAALDRWSATARTLPGVTSVQVTGAAGRTARLSVGYSVDPISAAARDLVRQLRAVPMPDGGAVLVGGRSAELLDLLDSVGSRLPWMGLVVLGSSFVLLFLAFGSVLLPIKAVLMNVLSLSASFGAIVWIFQDGHLAGPLGFTPTGTLEATQPILVLAIVFGLSMDYEVFLMSRIREQYDLTGDNTAAVATGLQRTGGIITSAALLLVVVIGAFSTSGITFIKLIGVAMIIAILVDATVVRALLVPATMRLLGRANWWAPAPMARFYARYGIREPAGAGTPAPAVPPARERTAV